jgi:hypothetical protein
MASEMLKTERSTMRQKAAASAVDSQTAARFTLGALLAVEGFAAMRRFRERQELFAAAQQRARALSRPLVVVGDPHGGAHTRLVPAYGCGDVTVDLSGCPSCPRGIRADITSGPVPGIAADSSVVFVSCVLEYVSDPQAAWREVLRMAGSPENVFLVRVQPWTATAALYPGARSTLERQGGELVARPVGTARKAATVAAIAALVYLSARPVPKRVSNPKPRKL